MKISNSIRKQCKHCKILYRFKRLTLICLNPKHKKHQ